MTQQNRTPRTIVYSRCREWFFKLFIGCFMCLILSSCSYFSQYENIRNSRNLRVGMTKQQVLDVMGKPLLDRKYAKPDTWFYYVDTVWHDFLTTEDECMPLVFENGLLVGWGNDFYNQRQVPPRLAGDEQK